MFLTDKLVTAPDVQPTWQTVDFFVQYFYDFYFYYICDCFESFGEDNMENIVRSMGNCTDVRHGPRWHNLRALRAAFVFYSGILRLLRITRV
jgi:hypothetical protein